MVLPQLADLEGPPPDVKVFGVQRRSRSERIKRPWIARWRVDGKDHSRSFRVRSEGERFRSALLVAQQKGEPFDPATGEPASWSPAADDTAVHDWARTWVGEQWSEWAPRTRRSAIEALCRLLPLLVVPVAPPAPAGLRRHLDSWLPPDDGAASDEGFDEEATAWLDQWSLRLRQLDRATLAEVDRCLGLRDDGGPLAPNTANRRRTVSRACIRRAVDLGVLEVDPWPAAPRGRSRRKSVRARPAVAVRSLPGPTAMAAVLDAMASHQPASRMYQTMTAVSYYAGLRPSEVVMLRVRSLDLPSDGWGTIDVTEADIDFDEPGEPKTGPRPVPIPPVLVARLRLWIDEGEFQGDDLLFRTREGNRPNPSNWARALRRGLAGVGRDPIRVYDCRHAAATTWLGAGVPLGEVAKRMGHSVETLVSTYVGALQGDEIVSNERIEAALEADGTTPTIRETEQVTRPAPSV